jgi:DNA invertase Pin-like site-specific DNA recombinase
MKTKPSAKASGKLAYSYRRYSSVAQTGNSSLPRQLEMAQEVCNEKGWTLIDLAPDAAISGYKGLNRIKGSLGSFLKRVKQGEVSKGSVLIIEKMDRFSRDEVDLVLPDFLGLLQAGVEIYSCADKTHYTLADIRKNPMTLNYAVMAMAMANDYSKTLGERVKRSVDLRLEKAKLGDLQAMSAWRPRWIDVTKDGFKFNSHAATIKRIALDYISGKSMYGIAGELTKEKVPTLTGGDWSQSVISHILGSPALIGSAKVRNETYPNVFPSILLASEYKRLLAKRSANQSRKGGSRTVIANLFRNRCKCHYCKRTVLGVRVNKCKHHLYICKAKCSNLPCDSQSSIRISDLEQDFFIHYLQESPSALLRRNTPEQTERLTSIQAEIAKLDAEIKDTTELIGAVPVSELKSKLAQLETKRQQCKAELDRHNAETLTQSSAPAALATVKELLKDMGLDQTGHIDRSTPAYQALAKRIQAHLQNPSTRQTLLNLLPSLVKSLVIDTTNKRYAIINHSDIQSPWRNLITQSKPSWKPMLAILKTKKADKQLVAA